MERLHVTLRLYTLLHSLGFIETIPIVYAGRNTHVKLIIVRDNNSTSKAYIDTGSLNVNH